MALTREFVLRWSIDNPAAFAVIVIALQLFISVLLAEVLSRFLLKRDVRLVHRLWCAITTLALFTIPLHLAWQNMGLPIAETPRPAEAPDVVQSPVTMPEQQASASDPQSTAAHSEMLYSMESRSVDDTEAAIAAPTQTQPPKKSELGTDQAASPLIVTSKRSIRTWVTTIYFLGVLWCLGRILHSYLMLSFCRAKEIAGGANYALEASQIARRLQLRQVPTFRLSNTVTNPFVFGWIKPVLVLPADFEQWTQQERYAVLAHELAHVGRNDFAWTLLSKLVVALYWIHPAAWWMDRRLTKARELAADESAVGICLDRAKYAEGLVKVLERLSGCDKAGRSDSSLAISMSSFDDLCDRVKGVLNGAIGVRPIVRWLVRGFVVLAFVGIALSSVKFRIAQAQSEINKSTFEAKTNESMDVDKEKSPQDETIPRQFVTTELSEDDNDLLALIMKAEVTPRDAGSDTSRYSFRGVVQDKDGTPVPNAVVVIHEHALVSKIMSDPEYHQQMEANPLGRLHSIRARVMTDSNGRYEFLNVDLPIIESFAYHPGPVAIIAAHPGVGIQFQGIFSTIKVDEARDPISLSPLADISLAYETPDSRPIAGAFVVLSNIFSRAQENTSGAVGLLTSLIQPIARTDNQGVAVFRNLPEDCIASCKILRGEWGEKYVSINTSGSAVANTNQPWSSSTISGDPAKVTAETEFLLFGNIRDEDGSPVSGVGIGLANVIGIATSDDNGNYRLHIHRSTLSSFEQRNKRVAHIKVSPNKRSASLLQKELKIPINELTGDSHELNIQLQRGIQVRGRIIDENGQPASGVGITSFTSSGGLADIVTTDQEGIFQCFVDPSAKEVFLVSEDGQYMLPTFKKLRTATTHPTDPYNLVGVSRPPVMPPMSFRRINLTISGKQDIQLQPFTVVRQQPIEIVVSLPNGDPARGAKVVLKDYEFAAGRPRLPSPQSEKYVADFVETNSIAEQYCTRKNR